ncbi:hypothetical protein [Helicobacter heilmannii]|uniref:Uncharacterized protein n=1 Tax=Helicobacter heilmannii TaxID=35817 RepID=A0A0K2YBD4_HELHE|nr:hypothetical protein [Helicobacter heilmannii]BDQ26858.1 hypothetical protein ASB1_05340 [Helicobacter heilmannii]CCM11922.1 hypothetical protein BN341_8670 [Helicobacter heilmannii ASB1.4]CRI35034.1 hypothetical protein HHE01_00320 [Helicobacter heilmannii]
MRPVYFPSPGQVLLSSRYGAIKARFSVQGTTTLPISDYSELYAYQNSSGVYKFAVCRGEGVLNYQDYPRALNFYNLDLTLLDAYLVQGRFLEGADFRAIELVKAFLGVCDLNASKNALYLNPPFFEEVQEVFVHALDS